MENLYFRVYLAKISPGNIPLDPFDFETCALWYLPKSSLPCLPSQSRRDHEFVLVLLPVTAYNFNWTTISTVYRTKRVGPLNNATSSFPSPCK